MNVDRVELTPNELATVQELLQAVRDVEQQTQGALRLVLKQHGLTGNWRLDGGALVRVQENPNGLAQ